MVTHFGPRAVVSRVAQDLARELRRLPRLIDNLHLVAERERLKTEHADMLRAPAARGWRIVLVEVIAVAALVLAVVAVIEGWG